MALPDIQDQVDERGIELDRVGIAGVQYPVRFNDGTSRHAGIATFDVTVTLPADRRGTHMSRMVEIIHDELQDLEPERLPQALKVAADRLDVDRVQVGLAMPMAFLVQAPASAKEAWQVCVYTDGVTEAARADGEEFGARRLLGTLRSHDDLPVQAVLQAIVDAVRQFTSGEQQDDITLVVARCKNSGTV